MIHERCAFNHTGESHSPVATRGAGTFHSRSRPTCSGGCRRARRALTGSRRGAHSHGHRTSKRFTARLRPSGKHPSSSAARRHQPCARSRLCVAVHSSLPAPSKTPLASLVSLALESQAPRSPRSQLLGVLVVVSRSACLSLYHGSGGRAGTLDFAA